MMPPLWLDYRRPAPGRRLPGLIVLGIGVVTAIALISTYVGVSAQLDEVQSSVARLKREALQLTVAGAAASSDATAAAALAGAPGAAPAAYTKERWEMLFTSLESAVNDSVTLLSLRPGASEVQLSGEALNLVAALDYVKRLQSAAAFGSVHLTQSEVVREHPQRPVKFALVARWREAPR